MDPSLLSTTVDTALIAPIAVGVTQLFKKLGVEGEWLTAVCFFVGTCLWAVMTFAPALWDQILALLFALSSSGLVAFTDERLQKLKSPR